MSQRQKHGLSNCVTPSASVFYYIPRPQSIIKDNGFCLPLQEQHWLWLNASMSESAVSATAAFLMGCSHTIWVMLSDSIFPV